MASWLFDLLPFEFASPFFLLGAVFSIGILLLFAVRRKPRYQHSDFRLLAGHSRSFLRPLIWVLVTVLTLSLFGALARPEVVKEVVTPILSRDIVSIFDASASMELPFSGETGGASKYEVGREGSFNFQRKLSKGNNNRFGYVVFAQKAYSMPLLPGAEHILKNPTLRAALRRGAVDPVWSSFQRGDTQLGNAILTALTIFERMSSAEAKVLIIMSDLVSSADRIGTIAALREAKKAGISRVYILAVSDPQMPLTVEIEVDKIEAWKRAEAGSFVRVFWVGGEETLEEAYREIEHLETSQVGEKIIEQRVSIEGYFLLSALIAFTTLVLLSFTLWRKAL